MANLKEICYKKSFLNQVIVRLDFAQIIPNDIVCHHDLENTALKHFPHRGKDQLLRFNSFNVEFDPQKSPIPNANGVFVDGIQKEFFSSDGKNKCIISNQFMIFEINDYSSFDTHRVWFQDIIMSFFRLIKVPIVRTGIRYINLFDAELIKVQKQFFSSEIAATLSTKLSIKEELPQLVRSMHTSEYRFGALKMNFRYGMYNPEYPNEIKKNSFALDYDCFSDDAVDTADTIMQVIDRGHEAIQVLFELSITDALRKVMQNE